MVRGKAITDIAPLAAALRPAGVRASISKTSVSDISAFAAATGLNALFVSDNLITDIGPLVHLPALMALTITGNPIDCPNQMVHIQALQARGVRVNHSCP
jgi:Leucine-rich repeat (LRR) protein